jgi:hypothetical protein
MRKLLKKRYFIPLAVIAVMAIGAVAAYAAFYSSGSASGTETTGNIAVTVTPSTWQPTGQPLVPLNLPSGPAAPGTTATANVDYQNITGSFTNSIPVDVYYQVTCSGGWGGVLNAEIWVDTTSGWQVLAGPAAISTMGSWKNEISQVPAGTNNTEPAVIAVWLNSSAGPGFMNQSPSVTFSMEAVQTGVSPQ